MKHNDNICLNREKSNKEIFNKETFNKESSLYKIINNIPISPSELRYPSMTEFFFNADEYIMNYIEFFRAIIHYNIKTLETTTINNNNRALKNKLESLEFLQKDNPDFILICKCASLEPSCLLSKIQPLVDKNIALIKNYKTEHKTNKQNTSINKYAQDNTKFTPDLFNFTMFDTPQQSTQSQQQYFTTELQPTTIKGGVK